MYENLNESQKKAVQHPGGPLLMAAGAGSGKTKALTGRVKDLIRRGVPPEQIVAITFTNKAANEMRERVFGKDAEKPKWNTPFPAPGMPFIGTFHALGSRILKQEAKHFGRTQSFTIYDSDDSTSLVKKICTEMDLPKERWRPQVVAGQISSLKSELKQPAFLKQTEDERDRVLAEIYTRYEAALAKNNAFDFDDLIEKPVRLFLQHPEILKRYQQFFSHILVDEYQDINTTQYQLVKLLAQAHQNISVVGDDAQAIYAFRGADFRNFLNFARDWPNATIIKLEQNYRSSGNIIAGASAVIKNNKLQTTKDLWTENPDGEKIRLVASEDPDTEAVWLANEISNIESRNPNASIAVLYRTNAQSRAIEQALISENTPYVIFGGLKFYERKEIKDLLAGIRLALNPNDSVSAERLEKSFGKRLGARLIEAMRNADKTLSAFELIMLFMEQASYKTFLETKFNNPQERLENIGELTNFASQFTHVEEFLERVALLQSADEPANTHGSSARKLPVNLMSIHIAKGLEFDYVFVVGINEGILPHEKSMTREDQVEEERRLMYVAMTRARQVLYLSFHAFPSRFLYEIPSELLEFVSPTGNLMGLPSEDEMYLEP